MLPLIPIQPPRLRKAVLSKMKAQIAKIEEENNHLITMEQLRIRELARTIPQQMQLSTDHIVPMPHSIESSPHMLPLPDIAPNNDICDRTGLGQIITTGDNMTASQQFTTLNYDHSPCVQGPPGTSDTSNETSPNVTARKSYGPDMCSHSLEAARPTRVHATTANTINSTTAVVSLPSLYSPTSFLTECHDGVLEPLNIKAAYNAPVELAPTLSTSEPNTPKANPNSSDTTNPSPALERLQLLTQLQRRGK